jgi:hypothetical protein
VGGGVLGHVEVDDPPAVVSEHDEDEEYPQARGGDRARGPVLAKAAPLPSEDGVGGHDQEGLPPTHSRLWPARPRRGDRSLRSLGRVTVRLYTASW